MLLIMRGIVHHEYDPDDSDEDPSQHGISPTRHVYIGGEDVLQQVQKHITKNDPYGTKKVTVTIMKEKFSGDLYAHDNGPGYSEVTPGSAADLSVGAHSIFDRLERYAGERVVFVMSDGPQNIIAIQMGDEKEEGDPA